MTAPRINWSLRFLILMRCTRELIRGKVFARLLNLFWRRLKDLRWPFKLFWVSIAMEIWSLIMLCELKNENLKIPNVKEKFHSYLEMCWLSLANMSRRLKDPLEEFIRPEPRRSSSLSTCIEWFCVILLNSVLYEWRISRWRVSVCIIAAPDVGKLVIFSFISLSLINMSSISSEKVSKENSDEINGEDSPLLKVPELILLNATNLTSISFSRLLAFFRIS